MVSEVQGCECGDEKNDCKRGEVEDWVGGKHEIEKPRPSSMQTRLVGVRKVIFFKCGKLKERGWIDRFFGMGFFWMFVREYVFRD